MTTDPSTRSRLAAIVAERRRTLGPEPSIDTLRAYLAGELAPEEAVRVQEHLATDPDLADLLLDLHDFERAEPDVPTLTDADLDDRLERFRSRVAAGESSPNDAPPLTDEPAGTAPLRSPGEVRPFRPSGAAGPRAWTAQLWPARAVLAAAAVLMVAVGAAGWLAGRSSIERAAPAVVAELAPEGSFRTRSGDLPEIEVPAWAERMVLVLPVLDASLTAHSAFRLEVALADAGDGTPVLSTSARPAEADLFTQILPARRFPPGAYRATVFGIDGGNETPLATYRFDVVRPSDGTLGNPPER